MGTYLTIDATVPAAGTRVRLKSTPAVLASGRGRLGTIVGPDPLWAGWAVVLLDEPVPHASVRWQRGPYDAEPHYLTEIREALDNLEVLS